MQDGEIDVTKEEKEMLKKIMDNQYTGGAYRRASFIDKVCSTKKDRELLRSLCNKGLVETGLGGTVAGDTYRACWLTEIGNQILKDE